MKFSLSVVLLVALLLGGCGQKGPLVKPGGSKTHTTAPASPSDTPQATSPSR